MTTDHGERASRNRPWHERRTAMLLYKAWRETRGRFLAALTLLSILGVSTVLRAEPTIRGWENFHGGERMPYALYVWLSLSHGYLQFLWIISAVILGLGGLVREHAIGTAGFTLSLPVSRAKWLASRAAVGALEAVVLALVPGTLVAILSPLIGRAYPLSQALLFGALLAGGGLIFYCLGLLLSHLFRGEYAAPGIGLGMAAAFYVVTKLPGLDSINVFALMTGSRYMVKPSYLLGPHFPFAPLAAWLAVALCIYGVAHWLVVRRDF